MTTTNTPTPTPATTREEATRIAEEWRAVPDWDGKYEVSNTGRVRSLYHANGKRKIPWVKKPSILDSGHHAYVMSWRGRQRTRIASRLVLLAFVGPPSDPLFEASHLDGDPSNNRLDNLVWESHVENEARKAAHGTRLYGERVPHAKMNDAQVLDYRRRFAAGEPFTALLKESGVSWGTLHPAIHGKTWRHLNAESIY